MRYSGNIADTRNSGWSQEALGLFLIEDFHLDFKLSFKKHIYLYKYTTWLKTHREMMHE